MTQDLVETGKEFGRFPGCFAEASGTCAGRFVDVTEKLLEIPGLALGKQKETRSSCFYSVRGLQLCSPYTLAE